MEIKFLFLFSFKLVITIVEFRVLVLIIFQFNSVQFASAFKYKSYIKMGTFGWSLNSFYPEAHFKLTGWRLLL